jgi:hypothetical protein
MLCVLGPVGDLPIIEDYAEDGARRILDNLVCRLEASGDAHPHATVDAEETHHAHCLDHVGVLQEAMVLFSREVELTTVHCLDIVNKFPLAARVAHNALLLLSRNNGPLLAHEDRVQKLLLPESTIDARVVEMLGRSSVALQQAIPYLGPDDALLRSGSANRVEELLQERLFEALALPEDDAVWNRLVELPDLLYLEALGIVLTGRRDEGGGLKVLPRRGGGCHRVRS